ncbi:MAG: type II toxin-antitoxin system HicA family toxin [Candidatus Vogelbacteria bacterium]
MPRSLSWRNLVKRLRLFGFSGPYPGGRHLFMTKGDFVLHIPNPHSRDISQHLLSEVLHQAGISGKDWNAR